IEEEIPHIASLMCDDVETLLEHAEVLVIGSASREAAQALAAIGSTHVVVDLTRGALGPTAPMPVRWIGLRRDRRVHVALDFCLREGAAVDPHLVDPPAEEVGTARAHDPGTDLQHSGDSIVRHGLRCAAGSTVEVHTEARAVRDDGHMVPAL